MTKASDNAFPSVLITEGTEPSAPAAGKQRLYIDSTSHHLKRTDSAGADVDIETAASGAPSDAQYVVAAANGTLSAEIVVGVPTSGGYIAKFIRKTSDELVNNSTTLQDDNELLFAIAASDVWTWEADIWYDAADAANFKFAYTWPSSPTAAYWADIGTDAGDSVTSGVAVTTASGTSRSASATGVGTIRHTMHRGLIRNGSNAGNVTLQWAQNTANGSDATVRTGSTIKAFKLA